MQYLQDLTATEVAGAAAPPDGIPYPGQKLHGQAGYQVAVHATGLTLIFDTTELTYKFLVGGPRAVG